MGAALVLLLVALGALAAGLLIGRYYVPDDRQLRRTARHSRSYMRALSHLVARDYDTVMTELVAVLEENVEDVEPYFALGALFRSRGEHERAIRVHQALAMRERERRKLRLRAMYELGLDFRAAGMPRRATRAMESVLADEPEHEGALRTLAALYEEQARFGEAAGLCQRIGRLRGEDLSHREHHLLVAAAQAALGKRDLDSTRQLLKAAQKLEESAHFFAASAELAAARGNHRGARERLSQALSVEPGLAPHLLPGLIAAERMLAADERGDERGDHRADHRADHRGDDAAADGVYRSPARLAPAQPPALGAPSAPDGQSARDGQSAATAGSSGADPAPVQGAAAAHASAGEAQLAMDGPAGAGPGALPGGVVGGERAARESAGEGSAVPAAAPLVPAERPPPAVVARVLAVLREIEAQSGPRLELALIRAGLLLPADVAGHAALAGELAGQFPGALAARVAAARLALARGDAAAIRGALDGLVGDAGALAFPLRGRWRCVYCGHRSGPFSWRCAQCRCWGTLRMETGIESGIESGIQPAPVPPRERRAAPRSLRVDGLLGAPPDQSLPAPTLDAGQRDAELARAGARRSLVSRVGGWWSSVWRRNAT